MSIQLSHELEVQLRETAHAQGVSVGEDVERLIQKTNLRRSERSAFDRALAERLASLKTDGTVDGEEVMDRLVSELSRA